MKLARREFVAAGLAGLVSRPKRLHAAPASDSGLERKVGITTGSFSLQLKAEPARFHLPELLEFVRGELDMQVVDVYTPSLASFDVAYLDRVRAAADKAGCVLTNLKMNQKGLEMASRDKDLRERSLAEYERSIDAAARLGMRWARPLPKQTEADPKLLVDGYRRLIDYGRERGIGLLVENFGWMQSDPQSVVKLLDAIGANVSACPDTGNWQNNAIRYDGLAKTFPRAVTCDFKAREFSPDGEHAAYDLKRCFTIGWGRPAFRGPWCLEHGNVDTRLLVKELRSLRDSLQQWMAERG